MKKQTKPFLSVVVPIFNEEKRIKNLNQIAAFLKKKRYTWELIAINDGSTDKTNKVAKTLQKKLKFRLINYSPNRGKGAAIKEGMLVANGKYRLFLDVDLSTPITEFDKLLPYLKKYAIVIGSRKMKGANILIRQPLFRELLGKLFTWLSQIILGMKVSDFTCGFKCFSKKAVEQIFIRQTINRWGFDSEILYIGKSQKYSIKEIPITWKNDLRTRVKFPNAIINSLYELIKIRINSAMGLYN